MNAKSKGKKKEFHVIGMWIESAKNHFWWSIHSSQNSLDLYERFTSMVHHCVDKHSWPGNTHFVKCQHDKLTDTEIRATKWIKIGSTAHAVMRKFLLSANLRKDLLQIGNSIHTTGLEVYHNVISKYLPKLYHFEFDHMEIGTILAALDNNENTERKQKTTITRKKGGLTVRKHFTVAYRKPMHKFIARKFYDKKKYDYLKDMLKESRRRGMIGEKIMLPTKRKLIAPRERDRNDLIAKSLKFSRF